MIRWPDFKLPPINLWTIGRCPFVNDSHLGVVPKKRVDAVGGRMYNNVQNVISTLSSMR
jgi:hypothetical protein